MKYISVGIVIIFIVLVIGFWIKRAPSSESTTPIPETPSEKQEQKTDTTVAPNKNTTNNKIKTIQGMKIEITKEGTGAEITNGKTAVVTYVGKLENGIVFDASKNHGDGSFSFTLGAGMVIKGWDLGVLGMKVGEARTLTIPADLAYGANGIPGAIPPNATLIFDVALLAIK